MNENKEKDPMRYLILFNEFIKIRKKYSNPSLTEEEKKKIWEAGVPIYNEMQEYIKDRKNMSYRKFERAIKKLEIPESRQIMPTEKLLALNRGLKKASKTKPKFKNRIKQKIFTFLRKILKK